MFPILSTMACLLSCQEESQKYLGSTTMCPLWESGDTGTTPGLMALTTEGRGRQAHVHTRRPKYPVSLINVKPLGVMKEHEVSSCGHGNTLD